MTDDSEWEVEIAAYPEAVKTVARKYPAYRCWRSTEDPEFHYCIIDYAHVVELDLVTVTLAHGSGTSRAGIATFGQDPEQLVACDCGKWKPPTAAEKAARRAHIEAWKKGRSS